MSGVDVGSHGTNENEKRNVNVEIAERGWQIDPRVMPKCGDARIWLLGRRSLKDWRATTVYS